ncbi:18719_t:CDS:1, partial [Gigaspora rosea]
GEDIGEVIKDISGMHIAEIMPNQQYGSYCYLLLINANFKDIIILMVKDKPKFGTIPGIIYWNEWKWPDDEDETGFICAHGLPGFGQWNLFSPAKIEKILKDHQIIKP